jgi:zinc transporter ZupT
MDPAFDWQQLLLWATGLSLVAVIGTIIGVPWVVARLPGDYFSRPQRKTWRQADDEPLFALVLGLLKNLLGAALVVMGLVMLLTPGQGLLTVLAGLLLMNFPGKYRMERWLVLRPGVMRALNWLRQRRGHAPFDRPPS